VDGESRQFGGGGCDDHTGESRILRLVRCETNTIRANDPTPGSASKAAAHWGAGLGPAAARQCVWTLGGCQSLVVGVSVPPGSVCPPCPYVAHFLDRQYRLDAHHPFA
jgi:hypothetical protein